MYPIKMGLDIITCFSFFFHLTYKTLYKCILLSWAWILYHLGP